MAETGPTPSLGNPTPSRPHMPASYGVKEGDGHESPAWDAVQDQLRQARNYWLATSSPKGRPHVMPIWGLWLTDGFYFGTSPESRKGRHLAANPRASVHLESGDDVVIVEGTVRWVSAPSRLATLADAYHSKYQVRPDVTSPGAGLYHLQPRRAFAWAERDFPGTATRWRFS